MQDFLKINDNDNVVVALNTIPAGEKITVSVGDGQKTVTAREEIPAGHKMAIFDIPEGGEVIKYGCIRDLALFELLEKLDDQSIFEHWEEIIERCCKSKADLVERDVLDMGERMILNFGHTIGHAIEGCYGFGHYTHGEGVAAGMSMLTGVTEAMGLTKAGTTARLRKVLEQYGLPTDVDASAEDLIPYISNDKKMRGNHMTLIILKEIGKGRLLPLAAEDLPKYIRKKDAQ